MRRVPTASGIQPAQLRLVFLPAVVRSLSASRRAHGRLPYEYDSLSDLVWPKGAAPHAIGRRPFGPITIANADAAAPAYTDAAIDMAFRAVNELARRDGGASPRAR